MQCELMQQQQQQQRVIPEAVMGLASCRDRDQNMYSDINVGGKSVYVKSADFLHLHLAGV